MTSSKSAQATRGQGSEDVVVRREEEGEGDRSRTKRQRAAVWTDQGL